MALCILPFSSWSAVRAADSGGLDWSAWQRMPVLEDGRIMPLDTFARTQVKRICGDVAPHSAAWARSAKRAAFAFRRRDSRSGSRRTSRAASWPPNFSCLDRRAAEVGRRAVSIRGECGAAQRRAARAADSARTAGRSRMSRRGRLRSAELQEMAHRNARLQEASRRRGKQPKLTPLQTRRWNWRWPWACSRS